ncbi:MAG: AAA family ATPase [Verrucomicrobiales bacterium]
MDPNRIEQLRDPTVFPEGADSVEIIQTHLSVVCLTGNVVYKLKKPIRLPFADFSTLEKRRWFCEEELRLNRRLCPEIYLEVASLRQRSDGELSFAGDGGTDGEIVDCAVRMKRLPANRMLDVLLEKDAVAAEDVEEIARRMTAFHREADRGPDTRKLGAPRKLREFSLANFEETRTAVGSVFPPDLHRILEARTRTDFDRWTPLLETRSDSGHVVDGHGDLHARNICLTEPVSIYDCIEFNPEFRCGDVATEHAFLTMDLRFRGHAGLAASYLDAVTQANGDEEMRRLMPMLVRYRAMVRAKVASITAGETELPEGDRGEARETALRYLRLAAASAVEEDGPWWLILCGLPASGKSTLATGLARSASDAWPVFASDRVRKELAGGAPTDSLPDRYYTPEFSRRTYDAVYDRAEEATGRAGVVILDANFGQREERARACEAATKAGAKAAILHLDADETAIRERLEARSRDPDSQSDADLSVYESLRERFERPEAGEGDLLLDLASGENDPQDAVLAALPGFTASREPRL